MTFDVEGSSPGQGLKSFARRAEVLAGFDDPALEAALERGIREQLTSSTERSEQAAGLTGQAQTVLSGFGRATAIADAATTAQAQRIQRQTALLELQQNALSQAGQLDEQRYRTNLQHQQFLAQLKMQKSQQKSALAGAVGGALLSVASGGLTSMLSAGMAGMAGTAGTAGLEFATGGEILQGPSGLMSANQGTPLPLSHLFGG
jgi:hypothetical protein